MPRGSRLGVGLLLASVLICTRNRAISLQRTLASLVVAAACVPDTWELVVVDNGSDDATPQVVAQFCGLLPIRRIEQPLAGLSNARNAGVAAAKGETLIWTDDDVLVDQHWLAAWFAGIAAHPQDSLFGGRAVPLLEEPRQSWVETHRRELSSMLALRDEPSWTSIERWRIPYGLNYAVRAEVQRRHPYDPHLGLGNGRRRGGEEVAVMRAILAEGGTGSWLWDAIVHHFIPAERQTLAYVRRFYEANGFEHPLRGVAQGVRGRVRGMIEALREATTAQASLLRAPGDVTQTIRLARARGSLRRYLS